MPPTVDPNRANAMAEATTAGALRDVQQRRIRAQVLAQAHGTASASAEVFDEALLPQPYFLDVRSDESDEEFFDARSRASDDESLSGNSVVSTQSLFTDRSGVMSPPDTLSITLTEPLVCSTPEARKTVIKQMMVLAVRNDFNLHVNMPADAMDGVERTYRRSYGLERDAALSKDDVVILRKPGNAGAITLVGFEQKPVDWPEDLIFNGKNSSHVRTDRFLADPGEKAVHGAINARREAAWAEFGIVGQSRFMNLSYFIGHSNRPDDFGAIPDATSVYSLRSGEPEVRSVPTKRSLDAALDGGNFLSNGAEPGARKFVIGLDAVAATRAHLGDEARAASDEDLKAHIRDQMGLVPGDQVAFVEQPAFHIDMVMNIVGQDEIVLNSPMQAFRLRTSDAPNNAGTRDLYADLQSITDAAASELRAIGFTVHEKPWVGYEVNNVDLGSPIAFTFMNGEYVRTQRDETLFITTAFNEYGLSFPISETSGKALEAEVAEFFAEREIRAAFVPGDAARLLLNNSGGIGCAANSLRS